MAASQGRFLALTARKTNVEYAGQQINQQRTTLSNQTANYNTQLLSLAVPTPPSSGDFTKTVYTFSKGDGSTSTIDSLAAAADGSYTVKYSTTKQETGTAYIPESDHGLATERTVNSVTGLTTGYKVGGTTLRALNESNRFDATALATLRDASSSTNANEAFYGADPDNNGSYDYYCSKEELEAATWTDNTATVTKYLMGDHKVTTQVAQQAYIQSDAATGRLTNIALVDTSGVTGQYTALTTLNKTDDAAYEDAMNQYNYNKSQYDKAMDDINARLNIVQQQDKTLELQLKGLDTEQEAISQEMDAVKKVTDKNIESTFKTFG